MRPYVFIGKIKIESRLVMYCFYYNTPIGYIGIFEKDEFITQISFGRATTEWYEIFESEVIKDTIQQLNLYFDGKLTQFSLPLNPKGTEFMKKVWKQLEKIPYGQTASYKDIAQRVNNPKGYRAVGMANNHNPIPIIIPCHRVIGSNGKMVGYAGGIDIKTKLLSLEGVEIK